MQMKIEKDVNIGAFVEPRDEIVKKISNHLSDAPLNVGENDYCYIKIVGNHLEIGRAEITCEE